MNRGATSRRTADQRRIAIEGRGRRVAGSAPDLSADAPAPAGVTPTGPQALPEGQRYRGYAPPGGPNATENNTENVVNSLPTETSAAGRTPPATA